MATPEGHTRPSIEITAECLLMAKVNIIALQLPTGARIVDIEWHGKTNSVEIYYEPA